LYDQLSENLTSLHCIFIKLLFNPEGKTNTDHETESLSLT